MGGVKFSLTGMFDIISGIFLYLTVSPVPAIMATVHAGFLVYKGAACFIPLPLGMPGFVLGSAADLISAAIIMVGQPPILGGVKEIIAFLLFIKGIQGVLILM